MTNMMYNTYCIHYYSFTLKIFEKKTLPKQCGKSTKVDFLIKDCNTVIETKMMRETLDDEKLKRIDIRHSKILKTSFL